MQVIIRGYPGTVRNHYKAKDGTLMVEIWAWGPHALNYFGWVAFPSV